MLSVTAPAAKRLSSLLAEEAPGYFLRVEVAPGGCSGFRYQMYFDAERQPGDRAVELDGVTVVVDEVSAPLLAGATLDWRDTLTESGFKIDNPNATRSCGCGKSFSG